MFKKAEKNELRTWLLSDLVVLFILLILAIVLIGNLVQGIFEIGPFICLCVVVVLIFLSILVLVKALKAYKSFDQRKALQEKEEREKALKEEEERKERLKQEEQEMAELKANEEKLRKESMEEIERLKKEGKINNEEND